MLEFLFVVAKRQTVGSEEFLSETLPECFFRRRYKTSNRIGVVVGSEEFFDLWSKSHDNIIKSHLSTYGSI
jgi:hypothetical protein